MRIKLGQIAEIRVGYTFRGAVEKVAKGGVLLVQMSDLELLKNGDFSELTRVEMKNISPEWQLEEGDLLIKARGTEFVALTVSKELHGAVFSHTLLRLRLNKKVALPDYIAWQLAQPKMQKQIHRVATGTSLLVLNLNSFKELDLVIPTLNQQALVKNLTQLSKKEEDLLHKLKLKRRQFLDRVIDKLLVEVE